MKPIFVHTMHTHYRAPSECSQELPNTTQVLRRGGAAEVIPPGQQEGLAVHLLFAKHQRIGNAGGFLLSDESDLLTYCKKYLVVAFRMLPNTIKNGHLLTLFEEFRHLHFGGVIHHQQDPFNPCIDQFFA